jgi:hydrogenase maturation protein HypF
MLRQVRMPGGAMAIKEPFRMAAVLLKDAFGSFRDRRLLDILGLNEREFAAFVSMAETGVSSPMTSSAGRIFDAVSALAGICRVSTFEGQAAIALESAAASAGAVEGPYKVAVSNADGKSVVDTVIIARQVALDVLRGVDYRDVSMRFHLSMAAAVLEVCRAAREASGTAQVALSGGVFQNEIFSRLCQDALLSGGFEVFTHGRIPPNDGGIAVGQAMVAREVAGCASRYRCVW